MQLITLDRFSESRNTTAKGRKTRSRTKVGFFGPRKSKPFTTRKIEIGHGTLRKHALRDTEPERLSRPEIKRDLGPQREASYHSIPIMFLEI